jgi:hypothetical protein
MTPRVVSRVMGLLVALMAMFTTLPALGDSGSGKKKDESHKASNAPAKDSQVASSAASASQDDRPVRYRLDDFYDDLKLPEAN